MHDNTEWNGGAILLMVGCIVVMAAIFSCEASDCHKKKCTTGEPVFFAREHKCLCSEVPK